MLRASIAQGYKTWKKVLAYINFVYTFSIRIRPRTCPINYYVPSNECKITNCLLKHYAVLASNIPHGLRYYTHEQTPTTLYNNRSLTVVTESGKKSHDGVL